MSEEQPKKPPVEKRSMVSEADIPEIEGKKTAGQVQETANIPPPEVTLLYIANHIKNLEIMMAEYLEIFKRGMEQPTAQQIPAPKQEVRVQQPQQPQVQVPVQEKTIEDARVAEIKLKLGELSEMLIFDTESSAQYIKVKPKQFLGSENFAKIASTVKNELHGQYVSAGKGSHFLVPKAKQ